jgi:hypothetical protein
MIRANDLANAATLWSRPLPAVSPRADARDASAWLDTAAAGSEVNISGDLSLAARGLSVEQHASRVLMHLRDDGDRCA